MLNSFEKCTNEQKGFIPRLNDNHPLTERPFSPPFDSGLERSLLHLNRTFSLGLAGKLEQKLYVADIPCGGGKTEAVCGFIKDWKRDGFSGDGSVLVALATKDEIDAVRSRCGLDKADFAAITSDANMNKYGVGRGSADTAKVVFTTHEQFILRVVENESFGATEVFHYKGKPRSLRIWDEAFPFATPASFNLWAWQSLPNVLRFGFRDLAMAIDAILPHHVSLTPGYAIDIPASLRELAGKALLSTSLKLDADQKAALAGLRTLAGGKAVVRNDKALGWQFVGAGRHLPKDVGPLIVLDASARFTPRYKQAEAAGFPIYHLPRAHFTFPGVTVHWWDRGAGKTTMANSKSRAEIFDTVGSVVNGKATEDWIVSFAKNLRGTNEEGTPDDLHKTLNQPERINVVTWGRHRASNEYRHIKNQVVIGALNYTNADYAALVMAAKNQIDGVVSDDELNATALGEFQANLYQLVNRTNVRNYINGVSGSANVYLIMPKAGDRDAAVRTALPGCTILPWRPASAKIKMTKSDKAKKAIVEALNQSSRVAVKDIIAAIGGRGSDSLTKIWKQPDFNAWMTDNGIIRRANHLYYGASNREIAA